MIFAILGLLAAVGLGAPAYGALPSPGVYINSEGSPLIPLLKNVKNTLDIEIYSMNDKSIRGLIREALARGVQVRILKEPTPVGDKCKLFSNEPNISRDSQDCTDQKKLFTEIRSSGGSVKSFNKQNLCRNGNVQIQEKCLQHGKLALADDIALISTGNFDSNSLCNENAELCDRDYTLILRDPETVKVLQNIFEADFIGQPYDLTSLIPDSLRSVLTISPYAESTLIDFIQSAEVSIDLETQYLKDPSINRALIERAKKGVQVSLTTASTCSFGKPKPGEVKTFSRIYSAFDEAGISTRMFNSSNQINGKPGYMHAKAIVVDGKRAWVGSINGSTQSLTQNREFGLIFDTKAWVEKVLVQTRTDHDSPNTETWEESLQCLKDIRREI